MTSVSAIEYLNLCGENVILGLPLSSGNKIPSNTILSECLLLLRGAVGKYVARSIISVTDRQTNTCLVSF